MTAGTPPAGPAARQARTAITARAPRRLSLVLAVIATAQLMVVLHLTIVNVALPHIQAALGVSGSNLEWVVNAYGVVFGGLLLLGRRSGDLLGRRRVFIAGLLVFSLASLLGGLATDQGWLITARAVQGAGAAMAAPTALSLIAVTFPEGRARNRAIAVYSAMAIVGLVAGLLAGGLLVTYATWRWGAVRQRSDWPRSARCSGCPGSPSTAPTSAGSSARNCSSGPIWALCSCSAARSGGPR